MEESTSMTVGTIAQKGASKLLYTIMMLIIFVAICVAVVAVFFNTLNANILLVGAPALLIYSVVCFKVKRGFRATVVWWGILSLLTAAWWVYLIVSSR